MNKQIEEMAKIICKPTANKGNCETCGFKRSCSKFDDATDLYNAGFRKTNKWIPVTERLPEGRDPILVTDGRQVKISYRNHFYKENKSGKIRVPANYGQGMDVTHWMPLPEPPETEKGGGEQ